MVLDGDVEVLAVGRHSKVVTDALDSVPGAVFMAWEHRQSVDVVVSRVEGRRTRVTQTDIKKGRAGRRHRRLSKTTLYCSLKQSH